MNLFKKIIYLNVLKFKFLIYKENKGKKYIGLYVYFSFSLNKHKIILAASLFIML